MDSGRDFARRFYDWKAVVDLYGSFLLIKSFEILLYITFSKG